MNLFLIGVAVMPVIILLVFIYCKDKYKREPLGLLMKALFAGMLSVIPAIILESIVPLIYMPSESAVISYGLYNGYVVAGACEELSKLALLAMFIWRSREFDEYFDGVVYAAFVSLGFAGVENIMYVLREASFVDSMSVGTMRAFLSVPGHFLFGVMMGYFFSLAKFDPKHRTKHLFKAFLVPALLHGTFDAILMVSDGISSISDNLGIITSFLMVVFLIFDIMLWRWGLRRIRRMQELSEQQDFDRNNPFANFKWDV